MRILLMPNSYPPVLGGLQTVAHTLARCLQQTGHQVRVVTNRYPRSLVAEERMDDIPVERHLWLKPQFAHLRRRRPDLWLASLYAYPVGLARLRRLCQAFQPEVINVHFPAAQIPFVRRLRRRFKFRLVVSLHGNEIERWFGEGVSAPSRQRNGSELRQLQAILREAEAVTACSQHLLNEAITLEPTVATKGRVIHNGIEPARFKNQTAYTHPRPYILAYGRLTHKKGFDLLLDAFADIVAARPHLDLILAGAGESETALRQQVRRLGLEARVCFFGRASAAEVIQLLNGCQFVVIPSRWEPFGIVALEALAAGKPLIATQVGGLQEFLPVIKAHLTTASVEPVDQFILLVPPTREGLTHGLQQTLTQPPNRYSATLRETILTDYAWATVAQNYAATFELVTNNLIHQNVNT